MNIYDGVLCPSMFMRRIESYIFITRIVICYARTKELIRTGGQQAFHLAVGEMCSILIKELRSSEIAKYFSWDIFYDHNSDNLMKILLFCNLFKGK